MSQECRTRTYKALHFSGSVKILQLPDVSGSCLSNALSFQALNGVGL